MGPIIEAIMFVMITMVLCGGVLVGFKMWMIHQEALAKMTQDTLRQKETTRQLQWASHNELALDKRNELRSAREQ